MAQHSQNYSHDMIDNRMDIDVDGKKAYDATAESTDSSRSDIESQDEYQTKLKAIQRKIDIKLLLWYSFVYLVLSIHKTNIANTAIMNEEEGDDILTELGGLSSGQWAWALSIFYYPYAAFEPASTLLLKRFKPSVWMSRIMITWGAISMCQGAVQNYGGILATRFFLGLAEAGFYPGVLYHLSFWYPADSMALRLAFFYACGQFSGTISGLLAYAFSFMNGVAGLSAWRWLFIIEGIPALLCGAYTLFFLPDYPDETTKFLTQDEKDTIQASVPKTQPKSSAKTWNREQAKALFADPTFATFLVIWICHAIGGWGVSKVLPTVVYDLGMEGSAVSQLMTMPTYAFGCGSMVFIGWLIQTKRLNAWQAAIGLECTALVMFILLITVQKPVAKYIFISIALACGICVYPIIWPQRIRAAHGTTAAGLAIGITNASAQMNGIIGPLVYQPKFGPNYTVSFSVSIALVSTAVVFICITWWIIAKRDRAERDKPEEATVAGAAQEFREADGDGKS